MSNEQKKRPSGKMAQLSMTDAIIASEAGIFTYCPFCDTYQTDTTCDECGQETTEYCWVCDEMVDNCVCEDIDEEADAR